MIKLLSIIFLLISLGLARDIVISGQVTAGKNHQTLSGVNVYIENSSIGTSTDANGRFLLVNVPPGNRLTLVFNYVGYAREKRTFIARTDTTINVRLGQDILKGPIVTSVATMANERRSAVTFSNIGKQDLQNRYTTQDIPELLADLPSTTFYSENGNGLGYNYLSIRGFGQRRISVLINGIPQNDPEDHNIYWIDFPDLTSNIDEIQVQRGAGNAFYGPAAIGGSINIKSNNFSPEFRLEAQYGLGSFNTRKQLFSVNSGLIADHYIFYGRYSAIKSDGYRERAWTDFSSFFVGAARYDTNSSLRLHFYGGPIKDGLAYNGLPRSFNDDNHLRRKNLAGFSYSDNGDGTRSISVYPRRNDEIENFSQPHIELLHEWQVSEKMTLNNSLFYVTGKGFFDYDGSWGTAQYFRLTPQFGYAVDTIPANALIRAYVANEQFGWLPQMILKTRDGTITFGAEIRYHRSLHWGRLQKGNGLGADIVGDNGRHFYEYRGGKDIFSFYYHQNYRWTSKITLQTDLQYAYKRYRLFDEKFVGTDFKVPYQFLNPRVGLNYNLSRNANAYFSLYSTTREPRLKNLYDAAESGTPSSWGAVTPQFSLLADSSGYDFNAPLVQPETLTGLEFGLGLKRDLWQLKANVYIMDFKNEIIKKGQVDRFGQPITGNAEHTRHYGLELSGAWRFLSRFRLAGNASFSRNRLLTYTVYSTATDSVRLDGNPIAGFPDMLANVSITYNWDNMFVSLSDKFVGSFYTDNFKNEMHKNAAYNTLNLNAHYKIALGPANAFVLQFRISNLLNRKYMAYGEGAEFFPAATRAFYGGIKYEFK